MKWLSNLSVFLGVSIVVAPARAGVIVYNDESAWQAAVSGITTESFNATTVTIIPNNTVFDLGEFDLFYTRVDGQDEPLIRIVSSGTINGSQELNLRYRPDDPGIIGAITSLELRFDSPIEAFGGVWNGVDPAAGVTMSVANADSDTINLSSQLSSAPGSFLAPFENGGFLGFVSDSTFSTIALSSSTLDSFRLENAQFSTSTVPEPSAFALVCIGLLGLWPIQRRWKRRKTLRRRNSRSAALRSC